MLFGSASVADVSWLYVHCCACWIAAAGVAIAVLKQGSRVDMALASAGPGLLIPAESQGVGFGYPSLCLEEHMVAI